ncbi:4'-phosphopantetheinyl transferase [Microbulbifer sp. A4B17]|uniref:4'-phosphopantetheinyl transferase family protein n=1 Tax=Microbulbifer sp. A4B17 TaxID=359370 RepID=UPI000D52B669|nr:4'-phosphopantetheinyl transferase superfamily protein [Microbulbifer sp. A4B17]AWF80764.1 4'-phosphopantetheinyl transferase [Microbulbifer sp. A4B17]
MNQESFNKTYSPISAFLSEYQNIESDHFSGCLVETTFSVDKYCDSFFTQLNIPFPDTLDNAVPSRRAEFLAGRGCAHFALNKLGTPVTEIPVGSNRCPIWPEGIQASITHAGNRAICAVSTTSLGLGVDYEKIITEKTAIEIKSNIVSDAEEKLLSETGLPLENWLTVAFSIKESLFKALYPKVGKYFDFLDAEITKLFPQQQKLELRILRDLSSRVPSGSTFIGRYQPHHKGILSIVEY